MRTIQISDDLFEQLKDLVVDPFDDTPDLVIGRLIEIVNKAKSRWSPLDACTTEDNTQALPNRQERTPQTQPGEPEEMVLL